MSDLFPASAAAASDGPTISGKPKRTSLMNHDTAAAKFLDQYAVSPLADVEHKTVWRRARGGDKWAEFWCELAADEEQGGIIGMAFSSIGSLKFRSTLERKCAAMQTSPNVWRSVFWPKRKKSSRDECGQRVAGQKRPETRNCWRLKAQNEKH